MSWRWSELNWWVTDRWQEVCVCESIIVSQSLRRSVTVADFTCSSVDWGIWCEVISWWRFKHLQCLRTLIWVQSMGFLENLRCHREDGVTSKSTRSSVTSMCASESPYVHYTYITFLLCFWSIFMEMFGHVWVMICSLLSRVILHSQSYVFL